MEFLYPMFRQYPVDEVCEKIVREVEKRNFDVPGLKIEVETYGTGAAKYRYVSSICGREFKLRFCRKQRLLPGGRYNDIAGVTQINIPLKEINIYEDESGPTFYLYVGKNWEKDRDAFVEGSKVNSKLNKEPRKYLMYHGSCLCGRSSRNMAHTHPGFRPPMLLHDNDLGREYDPRGRDPKSFKTDEVLEEFKKYLEEVVLEDICLQPIPEVHLDPLALPDPIPFPESLGALYYYGSDEDAWRIALGKKDVNKLEPNKRYALGGGGYRLFAYDFKNDGTVPEIAREGFCWCGLESKQLIVDGRVEIPGHYCWRDRETWVIFIKPNRANEIYIADHAQYEKKRAEIQMGLAGRTTFTDAEVGEMNCARARTIIPITEYKGDFELPVVLINRELDFDEVEIQSRLNN